ncbi:MAG: hypothetical protein KAJ57_03185 [Woeseiaceae bacterium]|nr:hypothetical protein [Woeseiaceae bacterium]
MRYYSTTLGTNWPPPDWKIRLIYTVFWFIPRANPDFERFLPDIKLWYLEVDDEFYPCREIGMDGNRDPVSAAPWGRNWGFWTDGPEKFDPAEATEIPQATFGKMWQTFQQLQTSHADNDSKRDSMS